MSIKTTWIIQDLQRNAEDGGVIKVSWVLWASDTQRVTDLSGEVSLSPDASSSDFISFENLTETKVLEWVHNAVNKEDLEKEVLAQWNKYFNTTESSKVLHGEMPWNTQQEAR